MPTHARAGDAGFPAPNGAQDANFRESSIIVVDDPRAESVTPLDDVLAPLQLTPRRAPRGSALIRRAGDCSVALVAAAEAPAPGSHVLEQVRRLRQQGCTVLCYGYGATAWPLGAQCRLLLAGASRLFDSVDEAFAATLVNRLQELLRAESDRAHEHHRIAQQMVGLGVIGSSPGIAGVFQWILRASAVSDLPVLIVGETGTGKELAARAIHRLDPRRRDRPYVPVNCSAISAGLAESELFGHRRGAFTGADQERQGLIRAARGGVLFLDEVGDLDLGLQGKLLRVLQERRVLPVGDDREVPVDVRIIAATNRDLNAMVRNQTFRADLFYRLNVLSMRMPALRERREDIEPLVRHFLSQCADQTTGGISASAEFVQALRRVELPGNVRQLENVVRRAVIDARHGEPLRLSDLPPELWLELTTAEGGAPASGEDARAVDGASLNPVAALQASSWKLDAALDLCEQQMVAAALGEARGNRSRAARLLGISPRSIFNKMRKHRLTA